MIKILYIDDEEAGAARRYQERLSRSQNLECRLIPPPELGDLDRVLKDAPDLFLVDYELSRVQPDGSKAAYRGRTLAAELRDRYPDNPIVLLTRESILDSLDPRTRRQLTEDMEPCDELLLKDVIDDELEQTQGLLQSIADGFRGLAEIEDKTWQALTDTLQSSNEEAEMLRETSPPLGNGRWIVSTAASWMRNVVLRFPGILYDPINAATCLGISEDSFWNEKVQERLDSSRYTGFFAPSEGRWWKDRLLRTAKELTMEAGIGGSIKWAFAQAFGETYGIELAPATCIWDHTPIADRVCYILRRPVKIANSLRYYPDNRPAVMDAARVSFRAIRERNDFYEELLDSEGLTLLQQIWELPEP